MNDRRRFVLRLTLAALGMGVFCAGVFVGLGWMVSRHYDWVQSVIGDRRGMALYWWYLDAASGMMPWDSDGDGYCDGMEIFCGTDPRNGMSHETWDLVSLGNNSGIGFCGERLHLRFVLDGAGHRLGFGRGFRGSVSTDKAALLAKGVNGVPSKGPLTVSPNAQGELEVDMLAADPVGGVGLAVDCIGAGGRVGSVRLSIYGWRGVPVPAQFVDSSGRVFPIYPGPKARPDVTGLSLAPPDEGLRVTRCVIERRRVVPGAQWEEVDYLESAIPSWMSFIRDWVETDGYMGAYEIRVMPVLGAPPAGQTDSVPAKADGRP